MPRRTPAIMDPRNIDRIRPVEWDHPLLVGCSEWWLPLPWLTGGRELRGLRSSNHGTLTNGPTWAGGRNGFGSLLFGTTQYVDFPNLDAMLPADQGTIVLVRRKLDTANRMSSAVGTSLDAGGTKRVNFHLPYSDGTAYFDWGGFANNASRLTVSGLSWDTDLHVWAFTVGGGLGMRAYRDGVLVGSNAGTPSRTLDADNVLQLNKFTGVNGGDLVENHALMCYSRALSASAIGAITAEWVLGYPGLLRRISGRTWSFPAAAGTSTFTAAASLTTGSATLSGSASHTAPTYTGAAALTAGQAVLAASATFVGPTYTAAAALSSGSATLAASATRTVPSFTASAALTTGAATLAGSAIFATQVYSASADLTVSAVSITALATFDAPVFSATASLVTGSATISASADDGTRPIPSRSRVFLAPRKAAVFLAPRKATVFRAQ